ncbi:MAG: FAD-dependent oxidoreductase [Desulfobacteraceae bacterium]|nr:FAD-dependent oxidoreductase [Desulfobacteraceae bacterium]
MKGESTKRLTDLQTLRIDPAKNLSFNYKRKKYQALSGDTVATALYSNGIRIFSRSLKYYRPRGIYSLNGECDNCYMEIDGVPNVPAEITVLRDNMKIKPQTGWPSPEFDFMGFADNLDSFMPAGFYYRRFHKPYKLWPFFLKQIRKAAGSGSVEHDFQMQGNYDEQYINADVCVIGGGPAGIMAAIAAEEQGLRTVLLEARPWVGGFTDHRPMEYKPGLPLFMRAWELETKLENTPGIRVFCNTFMTGFYSNNLITAFQKGGESDSFNERYLEIRAQSVVVATGCIERPLLFDNNDRPGIMQVSCAHRLARAYGLVPGKHAVFSIGHNLGLEAALDLSDLGMEIHAVADSRPDGQDPELVEGLIERRITFLKGWTTAKAYGRKMLNKVKLCSTDGIKQRNFECDILVASAGLTPYSGPLFMARAKMEFDSHTGFFLPKQLPDKVHAAGRLLGFHDTVSVETSGYLAGLAAAEDCGATVGSLLKETQDKLRELPGPARGSKLVQAPFSGSTGSKRFICFDEDATVKNVNQACEMGFDSVELAKRFAAVGTGPCQGGISGHNLPLVISQFHEDSVFTEPPSTIRSPLVPAYLATYAGAGHDIFKRTPVYDLQENVGAVFRRVGEWKRARYFSDDFTSREEIENVRNYVGIMDVSTLGKFRIFGPDALKALQRIYVGDMSKISGSKIKYSAMCNEDGCLIDDGVILKEEENNYYITTSSARAGSTVEWFRYHTRYEKWNFHMVNLTDAFGAINLAGPNARKVLQRLTNTDLSNTPFPFMDYRRFVLDKKDFENYEMFKSKGLPKIPVHVMRLGFVGELSYEIHVPASFMQAAWNLLMEAGRDFNIRPFGLEAQNALRLEKGHVIIGQESELRTTLHDLGMGALWSRKKETSETVGGTSLSFTKHQVGRLKLIGFIMENSEETPADGSLIVDDTIRGHVCTARYSYTLKQSIGMALVESQLIREGNRLEIFEPGAGEKRLFATVAPMPFYDPEGKRLK